MSEKKDSEKSVEQITAELINKAIGELEVEGGKCELKIVNGKLVGECDTPLARDSLGALLENEVTLKVKPKLNVQK
jgi:hypothetical protein